MTDSLHARGLQEGRDPTAPSAYSPLGYMNNPNAQGPPADAVPQGHTSGEHIQWGQFIESAIKGEVDEETAELARSLVVNWQQWRTMTLTPLNWDQPRLKAAVGDAMGAFWAKIAETYPEITSGDMGPGETDAFETAARDVVTTWLLNNRRVIAGIGQRVQLRRDVERFPHFIAPSGSLGTVVDYHDDGGISVRLDEYLAGAEEWDNEIHWAGAHGDGQIAWFTGDVLLLDLRVHPKSLGKVPVPTAVIRDPWADLTVRGLNEHGTSYLVIE